MSVICDIDGTLLRSGVFPMAGAINKINRMAGVVLVTGRPETERAKTVASLSKVGVRYTRLLMNSTGKDDDASQLQSKRMHATALIKAGGVSAAYDDNNMAQSLYKSLGIKTVASAP